MFVFSEHKLSVEEAYEKYADLLYRLALAQMQQKEDAEDVVADVFVKYMKHPQLFKDEEHEKAWFLRVTINRCHDLQRKKKYRNHVALDEVTDQPYEEQKDQLAAEVMETLAALPEKFRVVIVLHFLEGYSIEEIARTLKLSQSAVKMRISRGKEFLRKREAGE